MSVRDIASGLLVDLGCVPDTDENAALIEAAIHEAAKPLVEALERMLAARNIQERIDAPEAAKRALAAWRDGK